MFQKEPNRNADNKIIFVDIDIQVLNLLQFVEHRKITDVFFIEF